jgi:hypothetical protein
MVFYATQLLSKKGALGIIWIASHLDKQLKRQQIFEASITTSVEAIINPEAPLALRLSGQLLLGLVRIYSRKIQYLYTDCNDTLVKIRASYRAAGASQQQQQQQQKQQETSGAQRTSTAGDELLAPAAYDAFDLLEHEASQALLTPSQGSLHLDLGDLEERPERQAAAAAVFGCHACSTEDETFEGADLALEFDLDEEDVETLRAPDALEVRCAVLRAPKVAGCCLPPRLPSCSRPGPRCTHAHMSPPPPARPAGVQHGAGHAAPHALRHLRQPHGPAQQQQPRP